MMMTMLSTHDEAQNSLFPLSRRSLQNWQLWASLVVIACLFLAVFQIYFEKKSDLILYLILYPASLMVLSLMIFTQRFLRYPEVKVMAAFFIWIMISLALNDYRVSNAMTTTWFYSICVSIFIFFSLPYAVSLKSASKLFNLFLAVAVFAVTLMCGIGLVSIMTGWIPPLSIIQSGSYGIWTDGRLHLLWHPNTIAPMCALAILFSIILLTVSKKLIVKVLLSLSLAINYIALALTDSRAGIFGACLALVFMLFLLSNTWLKSMKKNVVRIFLSVIISVACVAIFYAGMSLVKTGYNRYSMSTSTEIPSQAEVTEAVAPTAPAPIPSATPEQSVTSRGLSDLVTLNGRTDIWLGTLNGLKENPDVLLYGATPLKSGAILGPYFPANSPIGNFHNSYLGIVAAFGLPGLLILAVFLVMLAISSLKLSFHALTDQASLWKRLIPAIVLLTVAEGMVEVFLFVDWSLNYVLMWFLLASAMVFRLQRGIE